jgi:chain length determinant protein tyrosine kinase EpsG
MTAFSPLKPKTVAWTGRVAKDSWPDASEPPGQRIVDRAIGAIIREVRDISDSQVEQILSYQREQGLRFGDAAVALKLATREEVLWALSQQFHYPYASTFGTVFNEELVVAVDPFGDQAEAFRELRSHLLTGVLASQEPRRALAVLSTGAGDGKTYFAANMAVALSQLGGRTLLVDGDMRTPRLHAIFGIPNQVGLSGVLSGRSEVDVIRQVDALPSLHVLPVGALPPNPLDLVQRSVFGLLLRELLNKFDHVIVDTPAASHGADGRVIAEKCGAALVIGRRNVSAVKPMRSLLQAIGRTQTQIAGVLINEHRGNRPGTSSKERARWGFRR